MKKYVVTAVKAAFNAGTVLGLTEKQAASRLHNLERIKSGVYRVLKPVEFKRGEEIGLQGEAQKIFFTVISEPESAKALAVKTKKPAEPSKNQKKEEPGKKQETPQTPKTSEAEKKPEDPEKLEKEKDEETEEDDEASTGGIEENTKLAV